VKWGKVVKVENGGGGIFVFESGKLVFFVKKSGKWGVFCKKSGPFFDAGCTMYSISIYFTFDLIGGGCIRTPCLQACCPIGQQQ